MVTDRSPAAARRLLASGLTTAARRTGPEWRIIRSGPTPGTQVVEFNRGGASRSVVTLTNTQVNRLRRS